MIVGGASVAAGLHHRLYRALLYPVVSERVTQGATSTTDALQRLNEFVYLNVRTWPDTPVIDDSAADTLIRGFGYCDPVALAFIRLGAEIDVPGRMLFLRQADGSSPHTVAEELLDGRWRVFDTLYGLVPHKGDGTIATPEDLTTRPGLLAQETTREDPSWYRDAEPVSLQDSDSGLPGSLGALLDETVKHTPRWLVNRLQDLYLMLPPPTYHVTRGDTVNPDGAVFEDYSAPDGQLYFAARNYQIFLRPGKARHAYRRLLARYPTSQYADDALYHLGVLDLTERYRPRDAVTDFVTLLDDYPSSPWRDDATYLQARAYEAAGDCAAAVAGYERTSVTESNGRDDARTRLANLSCS